MVLKVVAIKEKKGRKQNTTQQNRVMGQAVGMGDGVILEKPSLWN